MSIPRNLNKTYHTPTHKAAPIPTAAKTASNPLIFTDAAPFDPVCFAPAALLLPLPLPADGAAPPFPEATGALVAPLAAAVVDAEEDGNSDAALAYSCAEGTGEQEEEAGTRGW